MRSSIKLGMLALLTSTAAMAVMTVRADAAVTPNPNGVRAAIDALAMIDNVQVRWYRGRRYCWYPDGWRGPGWYRCGYSWRRGYGWGGPWGWRGWVVPGWRGPGWRGPGWRGMGGWGGMGGGGMGGGGMGGGGMGGGGMGGGGMGGGGMGGGGMGGGGMGGGGMGGMSDIRAKHAIALLGRLDNGLGFYRFSYLGSDQAFVGVMAQEVEAVRPDAILRHDDDGYLRVDYDRLGFPMQTWEDWVAAGRRIPIPSMH